MSEAETNVKTRRVAGRTAKPALLKSDRPIKPRSAKAPGRVPLSAPLLRGALDSGQASTGSWAIRLPREIAARLVALYDQWAEVAPDFQPDKKHAATLRKSLKAGKAATVLVGASIPVAIRDKIAAYVETTQRTKNFVARFTVTAGAKHLCNGRDIKTVLGKVEPSLSLVTVLALELGLAEYGAQFPAIGGLESF